MTHYYTLLVGATLLAIILQICIKGLRQKEVVEEIMLEPDEIEKLEKYEKVYNHFEYEKRGITFKDYLRKIEAGTHGDLPSAP